MKRFVAPLALAICLVWPGTPVYSQNETGTRSIDFSYLQNTGYWYDSTTAMFQHRYPIIRSIPPLSTDMPLDVLLSYVYTDSLVRFARTKEVAGRIDNWNSLNDTLQGMVKYLYVMTDYNPVIFNQYRDEIARYYKPRYQGASFKGNKSDTATFTAPSVSSYARYTGNLNDIIRLTQSRFYKLVQPKAERKALYSLLHCDHALRVRVISMRSTLNKNSPPGYSRYEVTAEVLDTLKGQVFPTVAVSALKSGSGPSAPRITFQYTPNVYEAYGSWSSEGSGLYPERDSAFTDSAGEFTMSVGQEAVVFLVHNNQKIDHHYDYYNWDIDALSSNGALPVINGQVRDVNHVWSDSTLTDYADWKDIFFRLCNRIISQL